MARPRLHDDALRTRLLDLASQVVSAGGDRALTVRSIATAAGTSPSAVYTLFGSREELVTAVSVEGFRRFAQHLATVPRTDDARADLRALGVAYRRSALADPHYYRVMFDRGVPPGDAAPPVEQPTFVVLRDAVARVLPADGPLSGDAAERVAVALWGLVHGLVSLELAGQLPGTEAERAERFAAATAAVGPGLVQDASSAAPDSPESPPGQDAGVAPGPRARPLR